MMHNDPALERAIARFGIDAYLRSHGLDPQESNRERLCTCPRCHRRKLYVNVVTGKFICFHKGCFSGSFPYLMHVLEGIPTSVARARLLDGDVAAPVRVAAPPRDPNVVLPPGFHPLTDPEDARQARYWRYLDLRRVSPALTRRYGIGYCLAGPCAYRVVVPVTSGGVVVHWVARDTTGKRTPKVLTPSGSKQSHALFNLDAVAPSGSAVLVEGVFDALRVPDRCVATFGTHFSVAQMMLLRNAGVRELIVAWDADARHEAAKAALGAAALFDRVKVARLPAGRDPSDLDETAFRQVIAAAADVHAADPLLAWREAL